VLEMEAVLVPLAILVILLVAKNGSSKRSTKPNKEAFLDDDTIYG
jgi:hypothetical protein